jgi:putative transposase
MTRFIEERRDRFEVELLCRTLGASPSTYYARRSRPPSARSITDAWLHEEVERVFKENYSVYEEGLATAAPRGHRDRA